MKISPKIRVLELFIVHTASVIFGKRRILPIAGIVGVTLIGAGLLQLSKAAGPFVAAEPENGSLNGAVTTFTDTAASGGGAVKFGSGSSGSNPLASLPLIPWEGGPAYWKQFVKADAAGWDDPGFFPILIDSAPFSSGDEIAWDP